MASVWEELKRRNVLRVAIAYAIVSWLILQIADVLTPLLRLPEWVGGFVSLARYRLSAGADSLVGL